MFWYAHHKWSRRFGLDDVVTVVITLAFVFITLVFVFPLRLMASALMAWLTQGWVPFELGDYNPGRVAFVFAVYGCGFTSMSAMLCLLYRHALKTTGLNLNASERFTAATEMQVWAINAGAGVLSTLIAIFAPAPLNAFAGWVYALLGVSMPAFGYWKSQQDTAAQNSERD